MLPCLVAHRLCKAVLLQVCSVCFLVVTCRKHTFDGCTMEHAFNWAILSTGVWLGQIENSNAIACMTFFSWSFKLCTSWQIFKWGGQGCSSGSGMLPLPKCTLRYGLPSFLTHCTLHDHDQELGRNLWLHQVSGSPLAALTPLGNYTWHDESRILFSDNNSLEKVMNKTIVKGGGGVPILR